MPKLLLLLIILGVVLFAQPGDFAPRNSSPSFTPDSGQTEASDFAGWNQQKDYILLYPEARAGNRGPVPLVSFLDQSASYRSLLTRAGIKFDRGFKKENENRMVKFVAVTLTDSMVMVWASNQLPPKGNPKWEWAGTFDERRIKGPWWKRTLKISARVAMMIMGGHATQRLIPGMASSDIHYH